MSEVISKILEFARARKDLRWYTVFVALCVFEAGTVLALMALASLEWGFQFEQPTLIRVASYLYAGLAVMMGSFVLGALAYRDWKDHSFRHKPLPTSFDPVA